jgi:hypothetical protein
MFNSARPKMAAFLDENRRGIRANVRPCPTASILGLKWMEVNGY